MRKKQENSKWASGFVDDLSNTQRTQKLEEQKQDERRCQEAEDADEDVGLEREKIW